MANKSGNKNKGKATDYTVPDQWKPFVESVMVGTVEHVRYTMQRPRFFEVTLAGDAGILEVDLLKAAGESRTLFCVENGLKRKIKDAQGASTRTEGKGDKKVVIDLTPDEIKTQTKTNAEKQRGWFYGLTESVTRSSTQDSVAEELRPMMIGFTLKNLKSDAGVRYTKKTLPSMLCKGGVGYVRTVSECKAAAKELGIPDSNFENMEKRAQAIVTLMTEDEAMDIEVPDAK